MRQTVQSESSARDFDFLMGRWHVHNRVLRERLAGGSSGRSARRRASRVLFSTGSETRTSSVPITAADSSPCRFASSIRRPAWSIYWVDSRRSGVLDPPVFGSFNGDGGVFEGTISSTAGRFCPVLLVGRDDATPRWEQAFSDDGGVTWETNWVMDFTPMGDDS